MADIPLSRLHDWKTDSKDLKTTKNSSKTGQFYLVCPRTFEFGFDSDEQKSLNTLNNFAVVFPACQCFKRAHQVLSDFHVAFSARTLENP